MNSREWYCRTCDVSSTSPAVPKGWYSLQRHRGMRLPPVRLGMYCSMECLNGQMPRLRGVERDLGMEWEERYESSLNNEEE